MNKFIQYPDFLGENNSSAIATSDTIFTRDLTANTEVTITKPAGARFALFQYDVTKFFVRFDGDALTVPTGSSDDANVLLNPDIRYIDNVSTIRLISPTAGQALVSFYG